MPVPSRRDRLPKVRPNHRLSNPGLALHRYVERLGDQNKARHDLHDAVCVSKPPRIYFKAYERWKHAITSLPGVQASEFEARTPLVVGLGNESVLEAGITLHHTYGVPFVPGSALKGLAANIARQQAQNWGLTDDHRDILFGTTSAAGYVRYFDAWYVPGSANEDHPFHQDVITVHHPRYYGQRDAPRAPWDLDDPTPVHYLNATGNYLVVTQCPEGESWAALALNILENALMHYGIGAKTSSGYGRMRRVTAGLSELIDEINAHPIEGEWKAVFDTYIERVTNLPAHERSDAARALLARVQAAGLMHPQGHPLGARLLKWIG